MQLFNMSARVGPHEGVIFLHGRKDPAGQEWLVEVQIDGRSWHSLEISGDAVSPAHGNVSFSGSWFVGARFMGGEQSVEKLKIYAGQPDPSDPSRFTIPVVLSGRKGSFAGRVTEGGAITLELKFDSPEAE